jgi:hypothetical protein
MPHVVKQLLSLIIILVASAYVALRKRLICFTIGDGKAIRTAWARASPFKVEVHLVPIQRKRPDHPEASAFLANHFHFEPIALKRILHALLPAFSGIARKWANPSSRQILLRPQ